MIIKQFIAGQLENNMYLVADEKTKKAVLIDASALIPEITNTVKELGIDVEYILLTRRAKGYLLCRPLHNQRCPSYLAGYSQHGRFL